MGGWWGGEGVGEAFGDGDGDGEARAAEGRRGIRKGRGPHRRPWTLVRRTGPPRTSRAAPGGRTGRAARGGGPARARPPPARRASRAWGRDGTTPGGLSAEGSNRGVASPITTTHLLQKRRTATQSGNFCREKGGGTRAGAHRRVGRRRRMDRSHEDDVRVLVDEVLRGVSTRAHRPGAVVGAHGDAPSSRHG